MRPNSRTMLAATVVGLIGVGCAATAQQNLAQRSAAETKPPFSGEANVNYALGLWKKLEEDRLVGPASIITYPYEGTPPHGKVLEYLETEVTYEGHTGLVMVKKNYAGDAEPEDLEHAVLEDRQAHLDSVTVMLRREDGYDPDHQNWFWAKYNPDGSMATNPKGMKLAGRVAKGADKGCIACHQAAPGEDYVFTHDRFAE